MRILLAAALLAATATAQADHHHGNPITVDGPWARASASMAHAGAAYLVLSTTAQTPDLLIAAAAPIAKRVELHTHLMEDGVMRMREVEAIEVAPGTPTVLEPGGLHIMLIDLTGPLVEGESFPLTLDFETAEDITVDVTIQSIMATEHEGHQGHGTMN